MANYFILVLDTTAPANPTISLEGGAQYAAAQLITATISTSDTPTTNYQMLIWGDVDGSYDTNIQSTEGTSTWIAYATSKQIKLSTGDGNKTVYVKIRDDVYNVSAQASDGITLDMTKPIISITGADVSKISKIAGKNTASFSFTCDSNYVEYKVKVVATSGATHDTGITIGTANGSVNMSGTGTFVGATPIESQIKGSDLELASSGDGQKIIKVFVRDQASNWSV